MVVLQSRRSDRKLQFAPPLLGMVYGIDYERSLRFCDSSQDSPALVTIRAMLP